MAPVIDEYYRYTPLSKGHIRLIHLHPGTGPRLLDGQIEFDIQVCALESTEYDAESYTWGSASLEEQDSIEGQVFTTVERCYPVFVDGKIVRVTRPARNVLQRQRNFTNPTRAEVLMKQSGKPKAYYTWIDGVCIDRDNLQERAEQVALMADLYARANFVIAFVEVTLK